MFLTKIKVRKKAIIRNRYNQVPHLTQDTISTSDKNTRKHHIQESQEVSPFRAGDHKAAMSRQDSMSKTNTKLNLNAGAIELQIGHRQNRKQECNTLLAGTF